jgi:hypothetical protein
MAHAHAGFQPSQSNGAIINFTKGFFHEHVRKPIESFSRSRHEKNALISKVLVGIVLPRIDIYFGAKLSRQELMDPQVIFLAERTDEVEVDEKPV